MSDYKQLLAEARMAASIGVQNDDGYAYSVPAHDLARSNALLRALADALESETEVERG